MEPPVEKYHPTCPCCSEECDVLYRDRMGAIVGCNSCIDALDAWDCRHLTD